MHWSAIGLAGPEGAEEPVPGLTCRPLVNTSPDGGGGGVRGGEGDGGVKRNPFRSSTQEERRRSVFTYVIIALTSDPMRGHL